MLDSGLLDDKGEYFELNSPLPPLAIPTSLQDSLTARLDRLPSISKELAQLAATIGRIFRHELLTLVSPMSEKDLVDALAQLLEVGLIYRRGLGNDVAYEFKHVLVQEAAYQLLLKSTRKQFHQRIAQVLAEQFPQTAESQPELLAHHYTESGLVEQAIPYWQHAGRRAIEHSANLEAVAHLYRALDLLNTLPESIEHTQQELAIQLSLGPTLMVIKGWGAEEVEQAYNRARELTENLEDQFQERPRLRRLTRIPLLFGTLWGLWLMNWVKGRNRKARRLVNELLALAEQRSNQALLLQAHHAAWTTDFARGQLDSCLFHAEQGFALYNRKNHRSHKYIYGGHDPAVCSQTFASITQWLLGHPDKALESVQAAIAMAQELDHPPSFLHILAISACRIHLFRREPQLVIQNAEETIALAKKHHLALYMLIGQFWRDWALVELGQTEGMIEKMRSVIDSARARGVKSHIPFVNAITAEVCTKAGRYKEGLELLDEAQAIAEQNDESWWDAEIYRMRGEILLSSSDEKQRDAEAYFHKAIEIARVQASKSLELRGATSLGRLWRDQGRREEARKSLGPIYDWFTEGFDTADLKEAKALLDDLA
jgi:predicted ATPase